MSREVAQHCLESHEYRWPPHSESVTKTVDAHAGDSYSARASTGNPRRARPGPIPTAGKIKTAAEVLIIAGRCAGRNDRLGAIWTELCSILKVSPEQRGYSLDTIQAAVRPLLLGNRIVESTKSTEN